MFRLNNDLNKLLEEMNEISKTIDKSFKTLKLVHFLKKLKLKALY